jgi:hypothetical protein
MKVCAHFNLSPYQHYHKRFDSIHAAKHWLWDYLIPQGNLAPYNPDYPVVLDVYPQCKDCNSQMNFHDYPMARYSVGPRGGIRKEMI